VANNHIVYEFFVSWASFICCYPSTIYEFKSSLRHKLSYIWFNFISLLNPPCLEEHNLSVSKLLRRISNQSINDAIIDMIYQLTEVLISSSDPPSVLMRMSYHMNSNLLISTINTVFVLALEAILHPYLMIKVSLYRIYSL
jgi:hypothetical protein